MNPYDAPQTTNSRLRRWYLVTVIIVLWCFSAAIGGFLLGCVVYFAVKFLASNNITTFTTMLQSDWWQVAGAMAIFGAAVAFPWGLARTKKLNSRLHDIYERRQSMLNEAKSQRNGN
jgi:hypothetical protein